MASKARVEHVEKHYPKSVHTQDFALLTLFGVTQMFNAAQVKEFREEEERQLKSLGAM